MSTAPPTSEPAGSWAGRVAFSTEGGGFAYRPGEVLVGAPHADVALRVIENSDAEAVDSVDGFVLIRGSFDALDVVDLLRTHGVPVQHNHVLFATCHGCCPPHPSLAAHCGHLLTGTPMTGTPMTGTPMTGTAEINPMTGTPVGGNSAYVNPALLPTGAPGPYKATGRGWSTARPAEDPGWPVAGDGALQGGPRIAVIDTALAGASYRPAGLRATAVSYTGGMANAGVPDADGDGRLDRVAGHSTFIAGLIERIVPEAAVEVAFVMRPEGDCDEASIGLEIEGLAGQVDLVNLSFAGYTVARMAALARAIRRAQRSGAVVVAAAGNDGSCRAPYPACLPEVVSVGAVGPDGPAPFTNYGPWVRASAPGVNLVSSFFDQFTGLASGPTTTGGSDVFQGWARWSGTSFSAPVVVAALAREMVRAGCTPAEAVARVIDTPGLFRMPLLGTLINVL